MSSPSPGAGAPRRIARPTRPAEAARIVPALARWYLEYLAGHRTLDQVGALLTPAVADRLRRRRLTAGHRDRRTPDPTIAATAVSGTALRWVSETRCEAVVLVTRDGRTTAIAMTLQRHPDRWRVTELASPERRHAVLRATPVPEPRPEERRAAE